MRSFRLCDLSHRFLYICFSSFFFFNDTATTDIYTLSLHDALPICMALLILALLQRIFLMSSLMLLLVWLILEISFAVEIGRAVQQECRDRSRMPSSA